MEASFHRLKANLKLDWFPEPHDDELLYSVMARLYCYIGEPQYAAFSRGISGGRHWIAQSQFPCKLDAIACAFGQDAAWTDRLIDQHSLLPFYTAFAGEDIRRWARAGMRGTADGLYLKLGLGAFKLVAPSRLRFCPTCLREMNELKGESWWRRTHQLPGIVVCAAHGEPLRNSLVEWKMGSRHSLRCPDTETCPPDSSVAWAGTYTSRTTERLLELARSANGLLVSPPIPSRPEEIRAAYFTMLDQHGLSRGRKHIETEKLLQIVRSFWGDALRSVPSLDLSQMCSSGWIVDQLRTKRKLVHPIRHLVLQLALKATPQIDQPFGPGPWQCLNRAAGHLGAPTILSYQQLRDRGKLHGRFSCACGYSYSLTRYADGSLGEPRFRSFGPTLQPFLKNTIDEGLSLRKIAGSLGIDPKTLIREAMIQGIAIPWKTKPSGRVRPMPLLPNPGLFNAVSDGQT